MGKPLSVEAKFFRFVTVMAVGGVTLGGRPVSSVEAEHPSDPQPPQNSFHYCEYPGEMPASFNDREQGSCLVKKLSSGESSDLVLLTGRDIAAFLHFSATDSESSVTLIVFTELGDHSPSASVAPKPGEALQMEYHGLVVTIEGREDGYFVSYTFRPEPKRWPISPVEIFPPERQA